MKDTTLSLYIVFGFMSVKQKIKAYIHRRRSCIDVCTSKIAKRHRLIRHNSFCGSFW